MGIGVIGTGRWGRNHVRTLSELGALVAVCDADRAAREQMTQMCPGTRGYASADDLLADDQVTGVVVAAPAPLHFALAAQALSAGRDVLVEKPLALTASEAEVLCGFAARSGRILAVGHLYEYYPAIERLHELIAEDAIGTPLYADCIHVSLGVIRTEEDVIWSIAPHDFAVLLRLASALPTWVSVTGWDIVQPGIADIADCSMAFPQGLRAHVHLSWLDPAKDRRITIIGDTGALMFDDLKGTLTHTTGRAEIGERGPAIVAGEQRPVAFSDEPPLRRELQHFLDCMNTRAIPRTDGHSGVRVLQMLELCARAQREGRRLSQPAAVR